MLPSPPVPVVDAARRLERIPDVRKASVAHHGVERVGCEQPAGAVLVWPVDDVRRGWTLAAGPAVCALACPVRAAQSSEGPSHAVSPSISARTRLSSSGLHTTTTGSEQ